MLSLEFELAWGENCSKNRKIHAKVDSRIYGRWAPDLSDGNSMNVEESTYFLHQCLVRFFLCLYTIFFLFLTKKKWSSPAFYFLCEFTFEMSFYASAYSRTGAQSRKYAFSFVKISVHSC